jgi:3-dehydroquinate dehydratase-1
LENIVVESTKYRFGARIIGIVTASNRWDPAIWGALSECDVAEFRADGFEPPAIARAVRDFRRECLARVGRALPILFTIRLKRDGGAWPDAEAGMRVGVWESLGLDGSDPGGQGPGGQGPLCEWVDVEAEEFASLPARTRSLLATGSAKLLLSHHDMKATLPREGLRAMLADMLSHRPAGVKFAMTCGSREEVLDLLGFVREASAECPNACVLSMGRLGRATRVLAPLLGCPFTYGYLTGGAVAPGQLSVRGLSAFYAGLPARHGDGDDLSRLLDWAEARIEGVSLAD